MMINKLKKMEKKVMHYDTMFIFFKEPSKIELAKLPPNSHIVIITGEDELKD